METFGCPVGEIQIYATVTLLSHLNVLVGQVAEPAFGTKIEFVIGKLFWPNGLVRES